MGILKELRQLPKNSKIPCTYMFIEQQEEREGLIVTSDTKVYLKHDSDNRRGSGEKVAPYKYSWFLCTYTENTCDGVCSDVGVFSVLRINPFFNLGEL